MVYISYQMNGLYSRKKVRKIEKYCQDVGLSMSAYSWKRLYRIPTFDIFKKIKQNVNYFGPKVWEKHKTWFSWLKAKNSYIVFVAGSGDYYEKICNLRQKIENS